jgi:hypothetical protein
MLEISDGDCNKPQVGSTVTIVFSDFTEPYIVKTTWLDEKTVIVGDQLYQIKDGKQTFNDGKYGGIPKIIDPDDSNVGLLKKINQLEDTLNKVNDRINGFINTHKTPTWTVVPQDGGLALQTAISTWLATPTGQPIDDINPLTEQSDIENPSIIHGDKIDI